MPRILLHTLVFPPDGVSTSILLSELTQDLQSKGHQITVLTTRPHYNRDLDAEAKQSLRPRFGGLYYVSNHHGMRVIHTWMPRKGQGVSGRLRDYLIFHILSLVLGILLIGRQDVVIVPSPPLSIGVIGWLLATFKGGKFIYNIQELYPALAVQLGLTTTNTPTYKLMAWLERFVYHLAPRRSPSSVNRFVSMSLRSASLNRKFTKSQTSWILISFDLYLKTTIWCDSTIYSINS